jgi:hypothetical protein
VVAAAAALILLTTGAGTAQAADTPPLARVAPGAAVSCGWRAAAADLAAATVSATDPRAKAIHDALVKAGLSAGTPATCSTGSGSTWSSTAAGKDSGAQDETATGAGAVKGIDDGAPGGGRTLTVGAGAGGTYRDISSAVAAAQPGDTVQVAAGTYPGFAVSRDGAPGKWLTIAAAPGASVVITGGGEGNGLVSLDGRSWVRLVGLTIRGSSSHGIYGDKIDHIVVRRCEVADSQDGGIVLSDGQDVLVQGANVHGNNARGTSASNEAISIVGTKTFEIVGSAVHDNGEEGIDAKYEAADGLIHDNQVWGNRGPNIYLDSAHDLTVTGNQVWGATEASKSGIGLAVENYSTTRRLANVTVSDNVVRDNVGAGIDFWVESSGQLSDVTVTGNKLGGNRRGAITYNTDSLAGITVRANTFGDGNTPPAAHPGVTLLGNVTGAIPAVTSALLGSGSGSDSGASGSQPLLGTDQ